MKNWAYTLNSKRIISKCNFSSSSVFLLDNLKKIFFKLVFPCCFDWLQRNFLPCLVLRGHGFGGLIIFKSFPVDTGLRSQPK